MNIPNLLTKTATIANGGTVSDAIDLEGRGLTAMVMPAAFTGTTITFQGSVDGVTYQALYNASNSAVSMTVAASRTYLFTPGDFSGIRYLKVVSGSAEGAARSILLVARQYEAAIQCPY